MTDRDALLRAICETPDDDLPRLVFADWLEEHGRPEWAEFIRVQCELAGLPKCLACQDTGIHQQMVMELRPGLDLRGVGSRPAPCRDCPRHDLQRRERELWGTYPDTGDVRSCLHAVMPVIGGDGWLILSEAEDRIHNLYKPRAVVRRGFVAKVMAPLVLLFGPDGCAPARDAPSVQFFFPGLLFGPDGCASALFKSMPVERVRLLDRIPADTVWEREKVWAWELGNGYHRLPERLFDRLPGNKHQIAHLAFKFYPTSAAALDAETAACVSLGRELVKKEAP